jgi:hypothetical protein
MSKATLDILNQDRENQIRLCPASEEFTIVGGGTFWGIFDRAHWEENKDSGNVMQKKLRPTISVSTVPSGIVEKTTKIQREDGTEFTLLFVGVDDEGVPLLWLY